MRQTRVKLLRMAFESRLKPEERDRKNFMYKAYWRWFKKNTMRSRKAVADTGSNLRTGRRK